MTSMINEEIRHIIEPELQPGEELLWADVVPYRKNYLLVYSVFIPLLILLVTVILLIVIGSNLSRLRGASSVVSWLSIPISFAGVVLVFYLVQKVQGILNYLRYGRITKWAHNSFVITNKRLWSYFHDRPVKFPFDELHDVIGYSVISHDNQTSTYLGLTGEEWVLISNRDSEELINLFNKLGIKRRKKNRWMK